MGTMWESLASNHHWAVDLLDLFSHFESHTISKAALSTVFWDENFTFFEPLMCALRLLPHSKFELIYPRELRY